MGDIGNLAAILALIVALYSATATVLAARNNNAKLAASARNGVYAVFGLLTIAMGALTLAMLTHQFELDYVASYSSRAMSWPYLISAVWAGNAGTLLMWPWLLSLFAFIVVLWKRGPAKELASNASAVVMVTTAFFLVLLLVVANPFDKLPFTPADGRGLNPLLENPGMLFHPPMLLAGFAGLALPFALAAAALAAKRKDRDWLGEMRKWALVGWGFLTIGNILGAWWAYVELGWGGYWGWDPVENSSLIPWLASTALLHSLIMQRRRGRHRVWVMSLAVLAFILPVLATFLTRTGVLSSVHAFNESAMGPFFLGFMALSLIFAAALAYTRRDLLKADEEPSELVSKEGIFQLGNIALVLAMGIVLLGTLFPLFSRVPGGEESNLGPSFYNKVVGPIFLVSILLIGVCTLIDWRQKARSILSTKFVAPAAVLLVLPVALLTATSTPTWAVIAYSIAGFTGTAILLEAVRTTVTRARARGENLARALAGTLSVGRVRYGAMAAHFGMALIAIGVIGSSALVVEKDAVLALGESTSINQYTITYDDINSSIDGSNEIVATTLSVRNSEHLVGNLVCEKLFNQNFEQPVTEVAIRSTLQEDLYIILDGWDQDGTAYFKFKVMPGVKWIWIGGGILAAGGALALWGRRSSGKAMKSKP